MEVPPGIGPERPTFRGNRSLAGAVDQRHAAYLGRVPMHRRAPAREAPHVGARCGQQLLEQRGGAALQLGGPLEPRARLGELEALPQLWEERRRLVGELPPVPPAAALAALERAADLQGRTTALLEEHLDATGAEMRRLVVGRSAMHSYSPAPPQMHLVDREG
ncbi:MAG: hypothetical protein QOH13_1149 [Thermoleophilaceae bacterium]|nr:hypothetical protein [Thermoleophilaceae bacterium]